MSNHSSAPSGGNDSGSSSSRVQPSSIVNEGKKAKEEIQGNIFKYALFLFALLIIWNMKACYQKNKKDETAKKAQVSAISTKITSTTTPTQARKLYLFSEHPERVVKIEIREGQVDFYPKGGEVEITPPLPDKSFRDRPGTINPRRKFRPGWYTVRAVDDNAVGIEIWN